MAKKKQKNKVWLGSIRMPLVETMDGIADLGKTQDVCVKVRLDGITLDGKTMYADYEVLGWSDD